MEEISEIASKAKESILPFNKSKPSFLPIKSKQSYEETYAAYKRWCAKHNIEKTTEDTILAYFSTKLAPYKTSTLWTKYSMLRTTINLNEGTDISKFSSIIPYLKRTGENYIAKKSPALTKENVDSFLLNANDEQHLLNKVILIFGVAGGCRRQELVSLATTNVEDQEKHFLVKLVDTKTKKDRYFIILPGENNLLLIIRKYMALRPKISSHNRFFINYQHQKCSKQPVGIHKIGSVPSIIAKFLGLPNPSSYTGHCFRKTSASILANSGSNMSDIWYSTSVAEGFGRESIGRNIHDGYRTEKSYEYVPQEKEFLATFGQDELLQDINDSSSECSKSSQVLIKTEMDESVLTMSPKTETEQELFHDESLFQDYTETDVNEFKVDVSSSRKHFLDEEVARKKRKILDIEEDIKKKQLQIADQQLKQLENNRKLFEVELEIKKTELEIKKIELYYKKKLGEVDSNQEEINNL